ncbi:MAG: ABC transporter substrate-binding protein [Chloroflexi bacterium]|nr:ABC transporter substrate-binding protein [Chloroflexota bacterium]
MISSIKRCLLLRAVAAGLILAGLLLPGAARATPSHSPSAIKIGGILTVSQAPEGSWTQNFNIWAPSPQNGSGMIWEPLLWFNTLKGGKITPWLATSYRWSNGNKILTFNLRHGVLWNDGKPFTSKDVLFSYQMAKKYPDFIYCNCVKVVTGVTTPNAYTVQFHLKAPDSTMVFWIGNSEPIPQHVFATLGDPTKVQVRNPVATGPFMLGSFSSQVFVLKRNPRYWQKGKPYLAGLRYPAYSSNDSAQLALVNGEIQYGGEFIPQADKVYAAKSPDNRFWYAPAGPPISVWLNDATAPFNNVHVRRAISLAIDRGTIAQVADYGYQPPANGALMMQAYVKQWGDPAALKSISPRADVAAAKAELAKAAGVNVSRPLRLAVVSGWSDWVTACQMIAQQLKAIGMNVSVDPLQFGAYLQNLQVGKFDMAMSWTAGEGNSPYYLYHDDLLSAETAPIGQTATTNFARYKNPALDRLLLAYPKTANKAKQISLMKQAERLVAQDRPIVPIMQNADWYDYNTKQFTGFPSAKNPYDRAPPWAYDRGEGNLDVVLHVHLK